MDVMSQVPPCRSFSFIYYRSCLELVAVWRKICFKTIKPESWKGTWKTRLSVDMFPPAETRWASLNCDIVWKTESHSAAMLFKKCKQLIVMLFNKEISGSTTPELSIQPLFIDFKLVLTVTRLRSFLYPCLSDIMSHWQVNGSKTK